MSEFSFSKAFNQPGSEAKKELTPEQERELAKLQADFTLFGNAWNDTQNDPTATPAVKEEMRRMLEVAREKLHTFKDAHNITQ